MLNNIQRIRYVKLARSSIFGNRYSISIWISSWNEYRASTRFVNSVTHWNICYLHCWVGRISIWIYISECWARSLFGKIALSLFWSYRSTNTDLNIDLNVEPRSIFGKMVPSSFLSCRRVNADLNIDLNIDPGRYSRKWLFPHCGRIIAKTLIWVSIWIWGQVGIRGNRDFVFLITCM